MLKIIQVFLFLFIVFQVSSQNDECIKQVLTIEDSIYADKLTFADKVGFVHYKVKSEDWDKVIVESEVKIYQNQTSMNFYSDQVDIFSNESELFMVLKQAKVIMAHNSLNKKSTKSEDEFYKFRKKFLKNCEVMSCYFSDSLKGIKVLKLKVKDDVKEYLAIKTMTYKFDTKNNKLISNSITYSSDYKLKKMEMVYINYKYLNTYNFSKPRKKVLNQSGKLIEKYKGYEFIDERN